MIKTGCFVSEWGELPRGVQKRDLQPCLGRLAPDTQPGAFKPDTLDQVSLKQICTQHGAFKADVYSTKCLKANHIFMFSANKILYSQEAFVVNKFDSGLDPTIVECLSEIVYPDR